MRDILSDSAMERLNAVGVCGARFHLGKRWGQTHDPANVRRAMDRAREIGRHARLHISGSDVADWGEFLQSIKGLTNPARPHGFAG